MKLMFFRYGTIIESNGGVEKLFCSMSNEFVNRGHDVLAVAFDNKKVGLPAFKLDSKVNFINIGANVKNRLNLLQSIKRMLIFNRSKRHIYSNNILDLIVVTKFNKIVETEHPDVIICFEERATRIAKKLNNINIPIISMLCTSPKACFDNIDKETKKYFAMSDCIQVLIPSFIQELNKYIDHNNVVSIGNAVPQTDINCDYTSNIIINVGRFNKGKQQDLLIKAFAQCGDKYKDWKIEFYGGQSTSTYFEYCQKLVKEYSLANNIHFCGTTNNIYEKLQHASIFAFPSAYEGFSLALTEAMSVGLPCIGFKTSPSVNELIKDGETGILCEDTIDALSDALKELMDDEEKRKKYGQQAKYGVAKYSPKIIWDEWENLIIKTVTNFYSRKGNQYRYEA